MIASGPRHGAVPARRPARLAAVAVGGVLALGLLGACSSTTEVSAGDPSQVSTNPIPGSVAPSTTTGPGPSSSTVPTSGVTTTSTVVEPPVGSSTSIPVAVSVPVTASVPKDPSIETQVFWVRFPDDDRTIDLPGYRDPASGSKPLVLYGSVTNVGSTAISNPLVTASWLDGSGTAQAAYATALLAPGSTDAVTTLEPGAMGDVIVVISDPDQIARLVDLAPDLHVSAQ